MAIKYATTQQLGEVIGNIKNIPDWAIGTDSPGNEAVGTGNNSKTGFWLDQKNIVLASYTLYANAVAMTETTDYTLDKTTGEITLTSAGVTKLSTNALTAKYRYFDNGMSDAYLTSVLERADKKVDNSTNTTFTDGTATNPTYPSETEIQPSPGYFRDQIIVENKPLIDVETTLNGDLAIDATTIPLTDASDYPSTGQIIIGSEAITYTAISTNNLTGATRGALGTDAATHTDLDAVHSTIFFLSNTIEGTAVTFTIQPWDTQMHVTAEGLIYSFAESVFSSSQYPGRLTKQDVANRVKIIYLYGNNTIPKDITRLSLLFAKQMLMKDTLSKAMIAGRDEFRPEVLDSDNTEINEIIGSYIVLSMGNT